MTVSFSLSRVLLYLKKSKAFVEQASTLGLLMKLVITRHIKYLCLLINYINIT